MTTTKTRTRPWNNAAQYKRPVPPVIHADDLGEFCKQFRLEMAKQGLYQFAHVYLNHYMTHESPQFHVDLMSWCEAALQPNGRILGACPRGHAKTTIGSLFSVAYAACLGLKRNIIFVGATKGEASAKMRNVVLELESNPLLRHDFGESILPARDSKNQWIANNDSEVILSNGVRMGAIGLGGNIRGQNDRGVRVDLIVLDDPESDRMVESETERRKNLKWIRRAMMNALEEGTGSIIWLGTLLHRASLLAVMLDQQSWPKFNIPALDGNQNALWPGRWSYEKLMLKKEEIGSLAFAQEYLNKPLDDDTAVYLREWFRFYDREDLYFARGRWYAPVPDSWEQRNGDKPRYLALNTILTMDPAIGLHRKNAYTAFCVLGKQEETGLLFLLHISQSRITFPEQLKQLRNLHLIWNPGRVGIEAIAYQAALAQAVEAFEGIPVLEIRPTDSKQTRIQAASVPVEKGMLYCPRKDKGARGFMKEAADYPAVDTVDRVDAFAMAQENVSGSVGAKSKSGSKRTPIATGERAADLTRDF